jgi:hypothetical protein
MATATAIFHPTILDNGHVIPAVNRTCATFEMYRSGGRGGDIIARLPMAGDALDRSDSEFPEFTNIKAFTSLLNGKQYTPAELAEEFDSIAWFTETGTTQTLDDQYAPYISFNMEQAKMAVIFNTTAVKRAKTPEERFEAETALAEANLLLAQETEKQEKLTLVR